MKLTASWGFLCILILPVSLTVHLGVSIAKSPGYEENSLDLSISPKVRTLQEKCAQGSASASISRKQFPSQSLCDGSQKTCQTHHGMAAAEACRRACRILCGTVD